MRRNSGTRRPGPGPRTSPRGAPVVRLAGASGAPRGAARRAPASRARAPGETFAASSSAPRSSAGEEAAGAGRVERRGRRRELVEQARVADGAGPAAPDEREVARDVGQTRDAGPRRRGGARRPGSPGRPSSVRRRRRRPSAGRRRPAVVGGLGGDAAAAPRPAGRPGRRLPPRRTSAAAASSASTRSRAADPPTGSPPAARTAARRSGRAGRGRARRGAGRRRARARRPGPCPGRPPARRAEPGRPAGASARPCSARIASMSRTPTGPSRIRAQRDRIVGSSRSSSSAQRMIVTPAGGSSRVLSRAAWASSFIRWAHSMIATRAPPSIGQQREVGDQVADAADLARRDRRSGSGAPARPARGRWRSGCPPLATIRQPRHVRHGRSAGSGACTGGPAARSSASVVLPTPPGPDRRTACGARLGLRTIAPIAARAAGWPRVRARSTTVRRDPRRPACGWTPASAWPRRPERPRRAALAAAGLRVEARFGLAAGVSPSAAAWGPSASVVALAAAGLRVEARFGLAGASVSESAVSAVRVAGRLGCGRLAGGSPLRLGGRSSRRLHSRGHRSVRSPVERPAWPAPGRAGPAIALRAPGGTSDHSPPPRGADEADRAGHSHRQHRVAPRRGPACSGR